MAPSERWMARPAPSRVLDDATEPMLKDNTPRLVCQRTGLRRPVLATSPGGGDRAVGRLVGAAASYQVRCSLRACVSVFASA